MSIDVGASSFPPRLLALCGGIVTIGGAEQMILSALSLVTGKGGRVHCIVNDWENAAIVKKVEEIGGTWSPGPYRHPLRFRGRSASQRLNGLFGSAKANATLIREAITFQPSAVLASDFESILRNAAALLALRAKGIPVVLYLQNSPPRGKKYRYVFATLVDSVVSHYVAPSRHSQSVLHELGIDPGKTSYVNNFAFSRADTPVARNEKRVVFAGQIIPQKGLDILLDAFERVLEHEPSATLDVIGRIDGWIAPQYESYRDGVVKKASSPGLRGRVNLRGWRKDVSSLLAGSAVHCAPSRDEMNEGMPLVCLEAKEAGTPSVVPPSGPFPELVSHRTDGWIAESLTPAAMADGLLFFLKDPAAARAAGEAARSSAERFSRDAFENRWSDAWARVLHGVPPAAGAPDPSSARRA